MDEVLDSGCMHHIYNDGFHVQGGWCATQVLDLTWDASMIASIARELHTLHRAKSVLEYCWNPYWIYNRYRSLIFNSSLNQREKGVKNLCIFSSSFDDEQEGGECLLIFVKIVQKMPASWIRHQIGFGFSFLVYQNPSIRPVVKNLGLGCISRYLELVYLDLGSWPRFEGIHGHICNNNNQRDYES